MPTRFLMICTCPGSDWKKSAGGKKATGWTKATGGSVAVGGGGRMPVLRNPHSGSLQPARIDGNAGRLDAVVGSLSAMNGSTVLPGPPLAVPVAVELVMVPTGKVEPGIDPAGKLMNLALAPAKPPTALVLAPVALPAAEEESMLPKFAPTKPPMTSWLRSEEHTSELQSR